MILVTGGSGLLGHHLIKQLTAAGQEVRAIYRSTVPPLLKDGVEWVHGDILDISSLEDALQGVTQVYHCAAMVSFVAKQKQQLHKVNVEGTANVVNTCLDANIQKLIHVSSVAALGKMHNGAIVSEAMQWTEESSDSEYGKSKYLAEMEVWRGIGEGLQAAIINPSIIIGEYGDWNKGSMAIFKNVHKGFPWYSNGTAGFTDAEDVVAAMIQLMNSDVTGERFIINNECRSFKDVFFMIADAFGTKRPHKQVTPFLASVVWRLEKLKSTFTKKEPLVTKETADNALATVNFDNSKFLKTFPDFRYRPLQQSIERICKANTQMIQ
jgi:dihydroflavonol-4-reductase